MSVAPVFPVLRVAKPVIGDSDATGEGDGAVHDQNLSMRAVVQLLERVPRGGIEVHDVTSRLLQSLEMVLVHAARAECIENDVHGYATARRSLERVGELVADASLVVDVGFKADAFSSVVNRLEHGGEHLIAVDEDVVGVAINKVGSDEGREVLGSGWIFCRDRAPKLDGLLVLRNRQHSSRDNRGDHRDLDEENDSWMARLSLLHAIQHCNFLAVRVPAMRWDSYTWREATITANGESRSRESLLSMPQRRAPGADCRHAPVHRVKETC